MTKYRNHDPRSVLLAPQYGEHVSAMTMERLHDKSEIAEELAARDLEMARMRHRIECLRGALKSAAGRAYEVAEFKLGDDCVEWAGDMEPPLMGSNV